MEEMRNAEGDSPEDVSPSTLLSNSQITSRETEREHQNIVPTESEASAVQGVLDGTPPNQNIVPTESETSAVQDALNGTPPNQNSRTPTENADGEQPNNDEIVLIPTDNVDGSHARTDLTVLIPMDNADERQPRINDMLDKQSPHSSSTPRALSPNTSNWSENGDSVGTSNVPCMDMTCPITSNVMSFTETSIIDFAPHDETALPKVESGSVFDQTSKSIAAIEISPRDEIVTEVARAKVESGSIFDQTPESIVAIEKMEDAKVDSSLIDTAAPFESVKHAVSMFGGITDWKAHKILTVERSKLVEVELHKALEDIPKYKKQCEAAEYAKEQVLEELSSTKRLIEELKVDVERAKTEETLAKTDAELAHLRAEEMEQGAAGEASIAAKAQREVTKARHETALMELKSVKDELEKLQGEYSCLVADRDSAVKRAEAAVSALKETEMTVEELTLELITAKESLESAHAAHLEAEEQRIVAALAQKQDSVNWEKELKQAEEELQGLNEQLLSVKDLESKLDTATKLLLNLKAELVGYGREETAGVENEGSGKGEIKAISSSEELKEVRANIEKAKDDIDCLRVAATSLKAELDREKAELAAIRQREGMASVAISPLEAELSGIKSEIELVQRKEKEAKEKMAELPMELQEASEEADRAKSEVNSAHKELLKVKEEAEQAKACAYTTESRLNAALKEINAAKEAEKLALAAVRALQESEAAASQTAEDKPAGITLSLEEYQALSKQAHEAEQAANLKVKAAMAQIEVAKESESRNLEKLEEANRELVERKEALRMAIEKADEANEGKLAAEQELRTWRAENEQRRRAGDATSSAGNHVRSPPRSSDKEHHASGASPNALTSSSDKEHDAFGTLPKAPGMEESKNASAEKKVKKKKSFFPRVIMFLARKKTHSSH